MKTALKKEKCKIDWYQRMLRETGATAAALSLNSIPGDGDTLGVAVLCGDSFLQLI